MTARPSLAQITPLILTYNEKPNIARCLAHLRWASQIIAVDSGSTDGTLEVLGDDSRVNVVHNPWPGFAEQRNHGMTFVQTPWVLSLDADHVVPPGMSHFLANAVETEGYNAWRAAFIYWVFGGPIRGAILPPREVLFRIHACHYIPDGHSERLVVEGETGTLPGRLWHDDRKSLRRWIASQLIYAEQESKKLNAADRASLSWPDRIRVHTLTGPILVPVLTLIRGGIFSGWRGVFYAFQRSFAELLLILWLLDARLDGRDK